jgi:hypothetical protein
MMISSLTSHKLINQLVWKLNVILGIKCLEKWLAHINSVILDIIVIAYFERWKGVCDIYVVMSIKPIFKIFKRKNLKE